MKYLEPHQNMEERGSVQFMATWQPRTAGEGIRFEATWIKVLVHIICTVVCTHARRRPRQAHGFGSSIYPTHSIERGALRCINGV